MKSQASRGDIALDQLGCWSNPTLGTEPTTAPGQRSSDADFAAKLEAIVGLYLDPPAHSLVLSLDEKTQIQALDRTQPGLPLKPGKGGTMTHDYKRHGTTTLFAALNVLDGTVVGHCMARHRRQEFLRFLNAIDRAIPAGKLIHVVLDNYAAHKHPEVLAWLAGHPRCTFHFTPTSASWLNAVETSSPRSPAGGSSAARSARSSSCRRRSTATSRSTTATPSPSSGPNAPTDPCQAESPERVCALGVLSEPASFSLTT